MISYMVVTNYHTSVICHGHIITYYTEEYKSFWSENIIYGF